MFQSGQLFYVGVPSTYCLPPMDPSLPHLPSYESVRKKDRQRQIHMMIADRFGLNGPMTAEVRPFHQACLRKRNSPLRWIIIIESVEFVPPCWPRVIAPVCSVIGLNDNGFCCGNSPQFFLRCHEHVIVTQMQTAAHRLCCHGVHFSSLWCQGCGALYDWGVTHECMNKWREKKGLSNTMNAEK